MTWVAFDRARRLARDRGLPAPLSSVAQARRLRPPLRPGIVLGPDLQVLRDVPGQPRCLTPRCWSCPWSSSPGRPTRGFSSTLDRIGAELASDSLSPGTRSAGATASRRDGFAEGEGTFNLCSFWYVEALTKRRPGPARPRCVFEKMLTYANHLGLFAEQIGASGEALGNFPQAFTHLALISAAVNLDRPWTRPASPQGTCAPQGSATSRQCHLKAVPHSTDMQSP